MDNEELKDILEGLQGQINSLKTENDELKEKLSERKDKEESEKDEEDEEDDDDEKEDEGQHIDERRSSEPSTTLEEDYRSCLNRARLAPNQDTRRLALEEAKSIKELLVLEVRGMGFDGKTDIPKEIPELEVSVNRAPSLYLLWCEDVKDRLLRNRGIHLWAKAVITKLVGPAATVARAKITESLTGAELKRHLLMGVYGGGAWWEVTLNEWRGTKLGEKEDPRTLHLRLAQLGEVLDKPELEVKREFAAKIPLKMVRAMKNAYPGGLVSQGFFDWERALDITNECFVDSITRTPAIPRREAQRPHQPQNQAPADQGRRERIPCTFCGSTSHWPQGCILNAQNQHYRADLTCRNCSRQGHGVRRCPFASGVQPSQKQPWQQPPSSAAPTGAAPATPPQQEANGQINGATRTPYSSENFYSVLSTPAIVAETSLHREGQPLAQTLDTTTPAIQAEVKKEHHCDDDIDENLSDPQEEGEVPNGTADHTNDESVSSVTISPEGGEGPGESTVTPTQEHDKPPSGKNSRKKHWSQERDMWLRLKKAELVEDCRIWIPAEVKDTRIFVLYDTGSEITFADKAFVDQHQLSLKPMTWWLSGISPIC